MKIFFSWDDGHPDDFKIKELFEKYDIPCMLFVPRYNSENKPVLLENDLVNLVSDLIEVGAHTYNHKYLTELTKKEALREIVDGKKYLQDVLGKDIEHFCLPGGRYDKEIISITNSLFRTTRTAETGVVNISDSLIHTTFHFYPRGINSIKYNSFKHLNSLFYYSVFYNSNSDYFQFMNQYIEHCNDKDIDIMIWGHSWELTERNLWTELENLLSMIRLNFHSTCQKYSSIK